MAVFVIGSGDLRGSLTGFKIVAIGAAAEAYVAAQGGVDVPMAITELSIALQVGVIDGVATDDPALRDSLLASLGDSFSAHTVTGDDGPTSGADDLRGSGGADVIALLGGADLYRARGGADSVAGGAGADTLLGQGGGDNLSGGGGGDRLFGGAERDLLRGGNGADNLSGGNGADTLIGGNGADSLSGGNGADTLFGGNGADALYAGTGADTLNGGAGADDLKGGKGNDALNGGNGNDLLVGGDGSDTLQGGNGSDTLEGRNDSDVLQGGGGSDSLSGGGQADSLVGGGGGDDLSGDNGDDTLKGGVGRDTLDGGAGKDLLVGGAGNDLLVGGAGADLFVFARQGQTNHDTIRDFDTGLDRVQLDTADYTLAKSGGNVVLRLGGGESLTFEGVGNKAAVAARIEAPALAETNPAIIYSLGGKFDKSFNEMAYRGAEAWAADTGQDYAEFELQSEAQTGQALRRFAQIGQDPIVVPGFSFISQLEEVAAEFPDQGFAIIDAVVDQPNVASYTFAEHEGAYVMGVMAATASQSGTIGFVGGMDIPLVRRYSTAFEQGAQAADNDIEVLVNMTGTTPAAWNDPVKGAVLAEAQVKQGADVIFAVAGGTGLGVMQAAADLGIMSIGVDADMTYLFPGQVLTSMVKRVDTVVADVFAAGVGLETGIHELGWEEGGLAYADGTYNAGILTDEIRAAADAAIADIIAGRIEVEDYLDLG